MVGYGKNYSRVGYGLGLDPMFFFMIVALVLFNQLVIVGGKIAMVSLVFINIGTELIFMSRLVHQK